MNRFITQSIRLVVIMLSVFSTMAFAEDGLTRSISVTGEAVVKVEPDMVIVTFGVETYDNDIVAAKEQNQAIVQKAFAAIRELGIEESAIQTDHISIEPRYKDRSYESDTISGYFVRNTVAVTLKEPEKLEDLLTKLLQTGITSVHSVNFQVSDLKPHREHARELALLAAKEKAEKMTAVLGQKLGRPTQIVENQNYWWVNGWGGRYSSMSQNVVQNAAPAGGEGEEADSVALGKISVRANVSVTFELAE